jgi:hypothetical protein
MKKISMSLGAEFVSYKTDQNICRAIVLEVMYQQCRENSSTTPISLAYSN